jgi:hypothetical protein
MKSSTMDPGVMVRGPATLGMRHDAGMKRRIALLLVSVLASAACGSSASKADGAAGGGATAGTSGAAGSGAATAGTSGAAGSGAATAGTSGAAGSGGTGGGNTDGGAPLATCPTEQPTTQPACTGTLYCTYPTGCSCAGCCAAVYRCTDGRLTSSGLDYNDSCIQGLCNGMTNCALAHPETCNDDPDAGGINGYCGGQGICVCPPGRLNRDGGRCLAP